MTHDAVTVEQIRAGREYLLGFGIDDMDDAEISGIYLAMKEVSKPAVCVKCGGTRVVQENAGPEQPCSLCARPVAVEGDDLVETISGVLKLNVQSLAIACKDGRGNEAADRIAQKIANRIEIEALSRIDEVREAAQEVADLFDKDGALFAAADWQVRAVANLRKALASLGDRHDR